MSIHVCECKHNGITEFHLLYPGMSRAEAQELADKINGGHLEKRGLSRSTELGLEQLISQHTSKDTATLIAIAVKYYLNNHQQ